MAAQGGGGGDAALPYVAWVCAAGLRLSASLPEGDAWIFMHILLRYLRT